MFSNTQSTQVENKKEAVQDEWLIRDCEVYNREYKDCRSLAARFHQYFVFGSYVDCSQWKTDCDNCYRWKDNNNVKAAKELIASEKRRRMERLRAHYRNDVWEKRDNPPDDWNKPLPEHMQKEYETTYLYAKSKEGNGELGPTDMSSFCSIM